jgi:endonuclease/exonuclease/phosphatase (EEP) superfamily protein YafD
LPFYLKTPSAHAGSQIYRVFSSNLRQASTSYGKARHVIQAANPDFLLLIEINHTWLDQLQPVLEGYPYSVKSIQNDNYGIALFSRTPIENGEIKHFGDTGRPTIVAKLHTDQGVMTVIGTHPPPPLDEADFDHRNQQFADLTRFVEQLDGPVLLIGDLNTTSWSPYFQELLQRTGLQDSRIGFGVQPSWPAGQPIFLVPIDHALVSDEIKVHNRKIGPETGSDHLPILLDFSFVK